jgi:rRNA maturation RNase YbeY
MPKYPIINIYQKELINTKFKENQLIHIVSEVIKEVKMTFQSLNIIFVKEAALTEMHKTYLNDPSPTDVITFHLNGDNEAVEGEIYISGEQAQLQAKEYSVSDESEILRLIIHGILHLAGYNDIIEADRVKMKAEENRLIALFS